MSGIRSLESTEDDVFAFLVGLRDEVQERLGFDLFGLVEGLANDLSGLQRKLLGDLHGGHEINSSSSLMCLLNFFSSMFL